VRKASWRHYEKQAKPGPLGRIDVHFIGHGGFNGKKVEGLNVFEDKDGNSDDLSGGDRRQR
jgi:hypothetical protein